MDHNYDDITPSVFSFKYMGKEYQLREASAGANARFTSERTNRITYNAEGGIHSVKDAGDLKPLLVSLCTFNSEGKSIGLNTIKEWPDRIVDDLFERAKVMSNIDQPTTIEECESKITILQEKIEEIKQGGTSKNS